MTRNIQAIVDKQLATWRRRQACPALLPRYPSQQVHEHPKAIALCFAPGTPGQNVADRTARLLGLPHHDHDIVEHIASLARVHIDAVESLDRHVMPRFDEYIESLFRERNFDRSDYMQLLCRSVAALWERGPCVLSGRGTVHIVPREHAITAHLVAPVELRARRLAQEQRLELREARRRLRRADAEQAAFHRRFFGAQVDQPEHYDLVADTSRLGEDALAHLLSHTFMLRFRRPNVAASA